jgi:soluble lytic murein transglycosylase
MIRDRGNREGFPAVDPTGEMRCYFSSRLLLPRRLPPAPGARMRSARLLIALAALAIPLAAVLVATPTPAEELGKPSSGDPTVVVGPAMRLPALDLPESVRTALRKRQWAEAAKGLSAMDPNKMVGSHKGDWAFLLAYTYSHAGDAEKAKGYLDLIDGADCVPKSYAALVRGEVYKATGEPLEALKWLDQVDEGSGAWPRAMVQRAEVLRELGRTEEAWDIYSDLAAQPDPSPGAAVALVALAKRAGSGNPDAYPMLRRVWTSYPRTEEAVEAAKLLAAFPGKAATWQEVAVRAEKLMDAGDYSGAILELDRRITDVKSDDAEGYCRFHYVRGRSKYKLNKLSETVSALSGVGEKCTTVETDYGARMLYLLGQAQFRTKDYAGSAKSNVAIADLYPKSSFADDGLTHAGIAYQELDDLENAKKVWLRALEEQKAGDTVPESTFRLMFALYMDGKPDEARDIAKKLGALPIDADVNHVAAGRYWAARLALYPDVNAPSKAVADEKRKQEAIEGWRKLCEDLPHSFYTHLAYSRLVEVAPDVAKDVAARPKDFDKGDKNDPWVVRLAFVEQPAVRNGVDLARLGLINEAMAEWSAIDTNVLTGDEMAWLTELRIASGDWLFAHDAMRKWMLTHPPGTLGDREPEVLRVAYPDRYWKEVSKNAAGYTYEPRLFHALCREESNFNVVIRSPVGARGLSQLMPATAKETARWMGLTITMDQLDDPDLNSKLGARYLDQMHKQLGGSPYLSTAAYNAGAGRVNQWLGEWGNVPTDEYVERIPFKETRGYVKRVMGSWQVYRYQFDDGPLFYDLSAYNHQALKK